MKYSALIIDVVDSRKYAIAERNRLQLRISSTIDTLNQSFQRTLIKPVGFSSGDEVQGLFRNSLYAYLYYRMLEIILLPYRIRGGIGYGEWTTRLNSQGSQAQDGPAYHLARTAIDNAKKMRTQRLCLEDDLPEKWLMSVVLNASYPLLDALSKGQLQILQLLECICPINHQHDLDSSVLPQLLANVECHASLQIMTEIDLADHINHSPEDSVTVKNVSEIIAEYSQTTRQNIENLMRRGNLLHIRVLDYCAACMLLDRKE